jgi:aqualysin 1
MVTIRKAVAINPRPRRKWLRTPLVLTASVVAAAAVMITLPIPSSASPSRPPIYLGPSWGLDRIDQRGLPLDHKYTYDQTGAGVTAYVIDGGIRTTHHEFGGRAVAGFSAFNDAPASDTSPCTEHGTHVAGTIGGATVGVAKAVKIVSVRVYSANCFTDADAIIAGVNWVTEHHSGPSVANMSLGHTWDDDTWHRVDEAVERSIRSGVTYVVGAGNWLPGGRDACDVHPARVPAAITVGATNSADSRDTGYSNYGRCVDLFAPGTNIVSAGYASDNAYWVDSGTSMATADVTGVAALYLQSRPSATPADVAAAVIGSATPNVVANAGPGSPNRLLYSKVAPTMTLTTSRSWAPLGAPVTIAAHLNTPIDNSVYFVRLLDTTTGQTLKQCVSGIVCETSVSSATLATHTYVAHLDRGRGGPPPYPIVSASPAIRVIWGPPIRLTVPHLTFATISFHTNDEDKDYDTDATVEIYAKNGKLVASAGIGSWQRFANNEDDGPFNLTTLDPSVTMSSLHGGSVRIVIRPNGHDTWRFNFNTRINFSDGGSLSVGRVGVQMSQEHEAYSWSIQ